MTGADTNGESQASEGIVLFRSSTKDGNCPDVARALRCIDKKLLRLLQVTLAADITAHIHFCDDCAYYPIMPTLATPIYPSLAALVDDAPDICSWLAAWASSTQRKPELTPEWARRRQIDMPYVLMIANVIRRSIAGSRAASVKIESRCGHYGVLHIPARPQITPAQNRSERLYGAAVVGVRPHRLALTASGQKVHIPIDVVSASVSTGSRIELHAAKTRRITANVAQKVIVLAPKIRKEP